MKKIILPAIAVLTAVAMNLNANATTEYSRLATIASISELQGNETEIVIETTDGNLWSYTTENSEDFYEVFKKYFKSFAGCLLPL